MWIQNRLFWQWQFVGMGTKSSLLWFSKESLMAGLRTINPHPRQIFNMVCKERHGWINNMSIIRLIIFWDLTLEHLLIEYPDCDLQFIQGTFGDICSEMQCFASAKFFSDHVKWDLINGICFKTGLLYFPVVVIKDNLVIDGGTQRSSSVLYCSWQMPLSSSCTVCWWYFFCSIFMHTNSLVEGCEWS